MDMFVHYGDSEKSMVRSEIRPLKHYGNNAAKKILICKNIYHSVCKYSCLHIYRPPILEGALSNSIRILILPKQKIMRIVYAIRRESSLIYPYNIIGK